MIQDASTQSMITQLRAKIADGTATLPEMREAIVLLRQGRHAALDAQGKAKKAAGAKSKAPAKSIDELMGLLGKL